MTRLSLLTIGTMAVMLIFSGPGHATNDNRPDDRNGIRNIVGTWGCSFNSPVSPVGNVGGVLLVTIDKDGTVDGTQTIATASMFQRDVPVVGTIELGPDDLYTLNVTIDIGGGPEQTEAVCVGADRSGFFTRRSRGAFNELRCIDTTDESTGESEASLSFIECRRR